MTNHQVSEVEILKGMKEHPGFYFGGGDERLAFDEFFSPYPSYAKGMRELGPDRVHARYAEVTHIAQPVILTDGGDGLRTARRHG